MNYDFTKFKSRIKELEDHVKKEFSSIRTGMASPQILDGVSVESYGAYMPINQVASVTIADARSLMVSPWDASQVKAIEKAITAANLGVSLKTDEKGVRVFFPELTGERRQELVKAAKEKLEQAKVQLRGSRDETQKDIDAKEKLGGMGEDDKFRFKAEMQKMVDAGNKSFEELFAKKEKEILG
ncbi:MAG: ribosome recycling factor [bacterium]